MNKSGRLKTSLILALAVALLSVSPASGKMRHEGMVPSVIEDAQLLVGGTGTLLPDGRLLLAGGQDSNGRVQATLATRNTVTETITTLGVGLHFPRAAHTPTVLPDGTVLILGGVGQDGKLVPSAELFDPVSGAVRLLAASSPAPRAFHTATLLTDGRVLVAGGVLTNGVFAKNVELWDPRGRHSAILPSQVAMPRRNHTATLLPDGRVLFSGREDETGNSLTPGQIFNPESQTVAVVANSQPLQESNSALTEMRASSPQDGAQNVPLDVLISVRFSRLVQMASVSSGTVTLQSPEGTINAKVFAAESGMLAFI